MSNTGTEIRLTESAVIKGVEIHSTPTSSKKSDKQDILSMMHLFLEQQNKMSHDINKQCDVNDDKFDEQNAKFNELRGDMNEIKEQQNVKFNEINTSIVKQFNKHCDEFIESQKQSIEKMKVWKIDTDKCNDNINNETMDDTSSDNCNGEIINNITYCQLFPQIKHDYCHKLKTINFDHTQYNVHNHMYLLIPYHNITQYINTFYV